MKSVSIVLAVTSFTFAVTGGWHHILPGDDFVYGLFYRIDTAEAEKQAWINWFLYTGPAGALLGLIASICFLLLKRRKTN